jgi:hypothetical protein
MRHFRAIFIALASSFLLISSALAAGDLGLYEDGVWFSDDYFLEGKTVRIWSSVKNHSDEDLLGSVRYSNQFSTIGGDQAVSALSEKSDEVFIDWAPPSPGYYTLSVVVFPWDPVGDETGNNAVVKQIFVESDTDRDGIADPIDDDIDGDGVINDDDLFPEDGSEWEDTDGDGTGDQADEDDDNDGVLDIDDDFPKDPLFDSDQDGDGIPDEEDEDMDGDGLSFEQEDRAGTDPENPDTDGDGVIDGSDPFPLDPSEWQDTDGDGLGDNSDEDLDGDGTLNLDDTDPYNQTPSADSNQDVYLTGLDDEVLFDASGSIDTDGNIIEYIWDFGDKIMSGPQVSRSFDATGLQVATLTVIDDNGQSDSTEVRIRVLDYGFLVKTLLWILLLISLAFYLIYRYNRRASEKKTKKKAPTKKAPKKVKKKKS